MVRGLPVFCKKNTIRAVENCVFCKIIQGEIPSEKVAEDENFIAILGIIPRYPGMTVIVSKNHYDSYLYRSMDDDNLAKMHIFAKKVAVAIDKSLGSLRCIQVMEGFDINHAHIKLFPCYEGKMYNASYEGNTKASDEELKKVAEKIRGGVSI